MEEYVLLVFCCQTEVGIEDSPWSRGLGDVYKGQVHPMFKSQGGVRIARGK